MEIQIRKIGNSKGAVIPAVLLKELGLDVNDKADASVVEGRLVVEKKEPEYSLEELLAKCPEKMPLSEEDKQWVNDEPIGKEVI